MVYASLCFSGKKFITKMTLVLWDLIFMLNAVCYCASSSQFLFKKYLNFEKSLGKDNERIQLVQQKAIEYVQSSLPSQDNS
jgi:hypothetical protein